MTTTRLTTQTEKNLTELEATLAEIARLTEKADALKWSVLDTRETGSQTCVARLYGVTRSAVGQWITARDEAKKAQPAPDTV